MILVHRSTIGSIVSAFSGGNIGTTRATSIGQALYAVKILAEAEQGDFDGFRIAAGLSRHLAEFRQDRGDIATGRWNPTVAIANDAPRVIRKGTADMDRASAPVWAWRSSDRN
jgi:hypothetical protein